MNCVCVTQTQALCCLCHSPRPNTGCPVQYRPDEPRLPETWTKGIQTFDHLCQQVFIPLTGYRGACRPGHEVYSAAAGMPVLYATARSPLNCAIPGHCQPAGGQNPGGFSPANPGNTTSLAEVQDSPTTAQPAMENSACLKRRRCQQR